MEILKDCTIEPQPRRRFISSYVVESRLTASVLVTLAPQTGHPITVDLLQCWHQWPVWTRCWESADLLHMLCHQMVQDPIIIKD